VPKPPFFPIPEAIRPSERLDSLGDDGHGERSGTAVVPGGNRYRLPLPPFSRQPSKTRHYSRFIRTMKLLLPASAAALFGLVVTWPQIQSVPARFTMGFANISSNTGEEPRMINARLAGNDAKGRPYSLTSENASQMSDFSEIIVLERPQADITLANGSWLVLSALGGFYSENTQILGLRKSVDLYHDSGYEFHTSSADIDLSSGSAMGKKPVAGQGPFGQISSQGFKILDNGSRIIFTGKAKLVILPTALEGSK
jgi:lipopolysaccharide export system protein LptC